MGLKCDELYKNPNVFIETVHEDDKKLFLEVFQQHLKGHSFDLNYRIVRPDGDTRWIHARSKLVKDSAGETIANVGSAVDITELKQFETAIAESERLLRKSQKVGGVGSYIVDIVGNNCRSSPLLNEILDWSKMTYTRWQSGQRLSIRMIGKLPQLLTKINRQNQ